MKFAKRIESDALIISVEGSILDLVSSSAFKKALNGEKVKGPLLLDLSRVEYLDSVIIGILVERFLNFRRQARRLVLFSMRSSVEVLLRTTSLLSVFDIAEDLEEALSLGGQAVDPDAPIFGNATEDVA